MLSNYQLKIADFYNIPIDNFKKLYLTFLIKKLCASLWKLVTLFKASVEVKKYSVY